MDRKSFVCSYVQQPPCRLVGSTGFSSSRSNHFHRKAIMHAHAMRCSTRRVAHLHARLPLKLSFFCPNRCRSIVLRRFNDFISFISPSATSPTRRIAATHIGGTQLHKQWSARQLARPHATRAVKCATFLFSYCIKLL